MTEQQEQAFADAKSSVELCSRVPHRAIELAQSAFSSTYAEDSETRAYALTGLGASFASLGRFDEAVRYLHEALGIAFELRLTYVMAKIHQYRGWIAFRQDKPVEALSDWQSALAYFRQIRSMDGVAWVMMHYAENYSNLGLLDHAIQCRVSALEICEQSKNLEAKAELSIYLGASYVQRAWNHIELGQGGYAKLDAQIALAILLKSLEASEDLLHPGMRERAYQCIGESLLIMERPDDAIANLEQALEASLRSGSYRTEARLQGAIAYAYFLKGDVQRSSSELKGALSQAPSETPLNDLEMLQRWLAMALQSSGYHREALSALWKATEISASCQRLRSAWWAQMHDATIGLNESLRDPSYVAERETEWVITDFQLQAHANYVAKLATTDSLTAVLNRSESLRQLSQLEKSSVLAAIFEITNIDLINSRFGRLIGDEVLRSVATALVATFGTESVIGRYSGSEFLVASQFNKERFDEALEAIQGFPWLAIDPELTVRTTVRFIAPEKPHLLAA